MICNYIISLLKSNRYPSGNNIQAKTRNGLVGILVVIIGAIVVVVLLCNKHRQGQHHLNTRNTL